MCDFVFHFSFDDLHPACCTGIFTPQSHTAISLLLVVAENSISKGLSALLQGILAVAAEGERRVFAILHSNPDSSSWPVTLHPLACH